MAARTKPEWKLTEKRSSQPAHDHDQHWIVIWAADTEEMTEQVRRAD